MRAKFPASVRLLRPSDYTNCLKGRRISQGALFVLLTPRKKTVNTVSPRLGLIIAKRFAPKAVTRNTIKRVLRQVFRQKQHQLIPADYVFRLYKPVGDISLRKLRVAVKDEALSLFEKVHKC